MTRKKNPEQPEAAHGRRAYEAPRILSREKLEVVAAVCVGPGAKETTNVACTGTPQS